MELQNTSNTENTGHEVQPSEQESAEWNGTGDQWTEGIDKTVLMAVDELRTVITEANASNSELPISQQLDSSRLQLAQAIGITVEEIDELF